MSTEQMRKIINLMESEQPPMNIDKAQEILSDVLDEIGENDLLTELADNLETVMDFLGYIKQHGLPAQDS